MRDVAAVTGKVMTAKVMRALDELDAGTSFLVEFTKGAKEKKDSCDWMGVLNASEIEVIGVAAVK